MELQSNYTKNILAPKKDLPNISTQPGNEEIKHAARDFTGIFFSECVNMMLDEVEVDDEEGIYETFKGLHAQVLAEKLTDSPAGHTLTTTLITALQTLQEKMQDNTYDN